MVRHRLFPGLLAAVAVALFWALTFRLSDQSQFMVNRLIVQPMLEILRLSW